MSLINEPIILDKTAKELTQALWTVANALGNKTEFTMEQIKNIIISGGGSKMFPVGTVLTVQKEGGTAHKFVFVHHGQYADGRFYAHLRLMVALYQLQYDSYEAFYYAESGLPAGNYNVQIPTAWSHAAAGYYNFTLANAVPVGGQLYGFERLADVNPDGTSVKVFASATATTASETVTMTRSDSPVGTTIGKLITTGDPDNANMNSMQRVGYGSNNWAQSAARQFLNSAAAAGSVWKPKTKFDRPPSWAATQAGFESLLPQDFLDIINPVSMDTVTNNVFETDYQTGSSYSTKDKFWLPSRYQIFGTTEGTDLSETQWDYYKGATDVDRIMYDAGGTARIQWLRSPTPGAAGLVRFVGTSGALIHNNACYGVALAPACEISAMAAS